MAVRFDRINNLLGWAVFAIALLTYWLTLEPTASYWDCGEYVAQADRLEIGHSPGNPIFILTGRFFANFAPSQAHVALMINALSGLLSALTILLLFWTITLLLRKLLPVDGSRAVANRSRWWVIFGSGVVGALAYTWSDTFWFSAVEAEVYAFSSFCTALVFWLILKWERRTDAPHSDRYLILIAYIIGISVAVHLLNLLCIPAIALIVAYKRRKRLSAWGIIKTLILSFVAIALILFGLIPGFVKVAQWFELLFVNQWHADFHSGAIAYVLVALALMSWAIYELYLCKSRVRIALSSILVIAVSGLIFISDTVWVWVMLSVIAVLCFTVSTIKHKLPIRRLTLIVWSIFVIFIGYSSYALIIIRAEANPPMNENNPDNVFALASYLSREQYISHPLIYGATPYARQMKTEEESLDTVTGKKSYSYPSTYREKGRRRYAKGIHGVTPVYRSRLATAEDSTLNLCMAKRTDDFYSFSDYDYELTTTPELNMFFPRIFSSSSSHLASYASWAGASATTMDSVECSFAFDTDGNAVARFDNTTGERTPQRLPKPTIWQNMRFFFSYQVGYMYFRYFLWNFSGRQNDRQSQGQADTGNFITGIPIIDDAMLGNQSLLPSEIGKDNKGHNVYYMLPLLLGIAGIIWQCKQGRRGRRQAAVIFTLFFMTGIAIVIYLNQTPNEPRERDYAFSGSFYAFAIWIAMGVSAIKSAIAYFYRKMYERICKHKNGNSEIANNRKIDYAVAVAACVIAVVVPVQMLSQTYDDHDRSGRTATRDYAINLLESLEENAILFTNGDNFTFPLWYVQEVEGIRRDVRVVNLAYLSTDWYLAQMMMPAYSSAPLPLTATLSDIAMRRRAITYLASSSSIPKDALTILKEFYGKNDETTLRTTSFRIPVYRQVALDKNLISSDESYLLGDSITLNIFDAIPSTRRYITQDELAVFDIVATNAANGWQRPIYWSGSLPASDFYGFKPYFKKIGMVYQLTPLRRNSIPEDAERYANIALSKFRWGGADVACNGDMPYFDETSGDVLARVRRSLITTASQLIRQADKLTDTTKYATALEILRKVESALPEYVWAYETYNENYVTTNEAAEMAKAYIALADRLSDEKLREHALSILQNEILKDAAYVKYRSSLPSSIRGFVSISTSITTRGFYQLIDTYLKAGGDADWLSAQPQLENFNFDRMKNVWERYVILQTLIRDARPTTRLSRLTSADYVRQEPEARLMDSTIYERITEYIRLGGKMDDLKKLAEFSDFDFVRSAAIYNEYMSRR